MKNKFIASLLLLLFFSLGTQAQEGTEIFLFDIKIWQDQYSISNPVNVTNNPGNYDNQPFFLEEGTSFLYSSADENGNTDIYVYDLIGKESRRLTYTMDQNEYSPQLMPDKKNYSVVILAEDETQRVWKYPLTGPVGTIIADINPVGYYAWYDKKTLAMFIVDDPNYLVVYNLESGQMSKYDDKIGRDIYAIPGAKSISYAKANNKDWDIRKLDIYTGESSFIVTMPGEVQDYTWTKDGIILAGDGSKIYKFDPKTDEDWIELADLSLYGLKTFTRIAINDQVNKLAVVVNEN